MFAAEENLGIVLDIGNHTTKAGYAGDAVPKAIVPSYVGIIENPNQMDLESKDILTGDRINKYQDYMKIEQLFAEGRDKYEKIEQICKEALEKSLKITQQTHPILLSEPSIHDKEFRSALTEIMFEKLQLPAIFIVKNAALSSFASGRTTSLILDSGAYSTSAVPIQDGYVLQKSITQCNIGGEMFTDMLLSTLKSNGVYIRPHYTFNKDIKSIEDGEIGSTDFAIEEVLNIDVNPSFQEHSIKEVVRNIKEATFKVSDITFPETSYTGIQPQNYDLPDGTQIQVGTERYRIPEMLFVQGAEGVAGVAGFSGVHQMVCDAINKCDAEIRRELYGNLIVTGGNSLIGGFPDRLYKKISEINAQSMKIRIIAPQNPNDRKFSAWIGGSILASLGSFSQMWISKQDYDENGANIVERKCP
ncbi:ARP4_2 [Blepharisma stoltei]|uniref:Actin n=1 Tax=Blepharisma stoltei TaxID=1481888 RepID=A0AAU9JN49_9CILI|nr:unnamed protein product [Blepharisma stoltei]